MYEKITILQLPSRIGSAARGRRHRQERKHRNTSSPRRPRGRTPLSLSAVRVRWGLGHRLLCCV